MIPVVNKLQRTVKMLRTIIALLAAIVMLILSIPVALLGLLVKGTDKYAHPPKFAYRFLQGITNIFLKLAGCNYKVEGSENIPDTPAIFVGNHQGDFDGFLVLVALGEPKANMAKKEIKVVPIAHLWMPLLNVIFVDRKNPEKARQAMYQSQDYIEHGLSLMYFPEGTRSKGPDMGPFKGGAFKTAVATGAPIVPFVVDGTYKIFEEQGHLVKTDIPFHILPPVPVSKDEDPRALSEKIRGIIQEELDRMRANEK